jgi:hypothetical protein
VDWVQVKLTVTFVLFQPCALAAGKAEAAIDGSVSSTFKLTLVDAVFPAASVAVPETTWFAPLEETRIGCGHCAIPEGKSEQLKLTVTFVLFHPAESGVGETLAVIDGAVSSMFTFTVTVEVTPALSVAVPVTT